jgi:hypothetical protein
VSVRNSPSWEKQVVPRITLFFGVILALVGALCYHLTNYVSVTALIPTFFGVAFMILGFVAGKESLRKHAMHAAAALAALGFVFGVVRVVMALAQGKEIGTAFVETAVFAGLCGVLLLLCVKSFIDARRRRAQRGET